MRTFLFVPGLTVRTTRIVRPAPGGVYGEYVGRIQRLLMARENLDKRLR